MYITDKIWEQLFPTIEKGQEFITREDLEKGIKNNTYQLFKDDNCSLVTASHLDILRIGIAGGNLQSIIKITEKVEKYAKKRNYKNIEIVGRAGWEKLLNGYKKQEVILRKEL
jgi:predicted ThiF/HesA family dinucleotide-utilizing enzyme